MNVISPLAARFARACLLAALVQTAPGRAAEPASGEDVWDESCARCHRTVRRIAYALPEPDDAAARSRLDRFLTGHHLPDPQARAALVDWLADQARQ